MENTKKIWFKRKLYGWGWTPSTWQGWLVTLVYFILILILVFNIEESVPGNPDSGSNFLVLGFPVLLLSLLFIFTAYKKGEKPRWQWGKDLGE